MAALKTQKNDASVTDFLGDNQDALTLLDIFTKVTGETACMWGDSIVGFGEYHYKYASGQEGDWPRAGFSPRKANISIYIMPGINKYPKLLAKLGKHKASKGSCLYIKKLADIDVEVLSEIITQSMEDMQKMYPAV